MKWGWECPRCHRIYSPTKEECSQCNTERTDFEEEHTLKRWHSKGCKCKVCFERSIEGI